MENKKSRPILAVKMQSGEIWCASEYDSPKELWEYAKKYKIEGHFQSVSFTGATVIDTE